MPERSQATVDPAERAGEVTRPYVPPIDPTDLTARNQAAIRLLDSWEAEGDEGERRETMEALRQTRGRDRVASSRPLFP